MGGGNKSNEGYVEALGSNHEWGGICDDNWDIHDGKVVCKMLGYPTAETVFHRARFGEAPSGDRFILDNLNCTGNESSVFDCPHNGEWNENCRAHEIAGVRCGNETKSEFKIKSWNLISSRQYEAITFQAFVELQFQL